MSRSGYADDCDGWDLIRWRGAVKSAIRGRRGQAFMREMLAALDALPEPRLIEEDLVTSEGCCALGAVAKARGLDVGDVEPYDREAVAVRFGIPLALACEVAHQNDDGGPWLPRHQRESPEDRFRRVRAWIVEQIVT